VLAASIVRGTYDCPENMELPPISDPTIGFCCRQALVLTIGF